jgi:glycosyltransferase involved in cell wall biosynthesis
MAEPRLHAAHPAGVLGVGLSPVTGRPLRIALVNWTARVAGGVETYLRDLIPALLARGHAVALFAESDVPADRPPITGHEVRIVDTPARAREALGTWRPDVLFVHGLENAEVERSILETGPVAYFAHNYRGTCISGEKAHKFPARVPCARAFGLACLALFYPRRCGGLNPLTMARDYARQRGRLDRLGTARALITASAHMREEYLRHGFSPDRVVHLPLPVPDLTALPALSALPAPSRLIWSGRMERPKGGDLCLEATALAARALDRPLELTLFGDGRERRAWERRAGRLARGGAPLRVNFAGWVAAEAMDRAFAAADLLVLSSVWPEPYGRVGLEAGRHGVPAAAFAVGGIPEWLEDGVNGRMAPARPPRAPGLASAIVGCLRDPAEHARLRAGARAAAARLGFTDHAARLERVFREIIARG